MEKILIMDGHYDEWTTFMWEILKDEFPTEEIDEIIEESYDEARDGGAYIVIRSNAEKYDGLGYFSVQGYASDIFEKQYFVEYTEASDDEINSEYFHVYRVEQGETKTSPVDAHHIEYLENKITELQNIIINMMLSGTAQDSKPVTVNDTTFVELVNRFNKTVSNDDETFYNQEYTMTWNGLRTNFSQCPALYDFFERYEQEYL